MINHPLQTQDWEMLARQACFQPDSLAALCQMSLRQLERRFKRDFKKTPSKWSRELRCRLARQRISEGWSTKAVAAYLHFWDAAHLCHEFKQVYGVAPQDFAPRAGHERAPVTSHISALP